MTISPRALIGALPALLVVVGSLIMSRKVAHEADRTEYSVLVRADELWYPSIEDEDRLHRLALKQETVEDLLDGRLSLQEATERFESFAKLAELDPDPLHQPSDDTNRQRALQQVLAYAHVRANQNPERFASAVKHLDEVAASLFAGTNRLPTVVGY